MSWPPLVAKGGAQPSGDWTIIARHDDRKQWACKGKPRYRWDNDKNRVTAGSTTTAGTSWYRAHNPNWQT